MNINIDHGKQQINITLDNGERRTVEFRRWPDPRGDAERQNDADQIRELKELLVSLRCHAARMQRERDEARRLWSITGTRIRFERDDALKELSELKKSIRLQYGVCSIL